MPAQQHQWLLKFRSFIRQTSSCVHMDMHSHAHKRTYTHMHTYIHMQHVHTCTMHACICTPYTIITMLFIIYVYKHIWTYVYSFAEVL